MRTRLRHTFAIAPGPAPCWHKRRHHWGDGRSLPPRPGWPPPIADAAREPGHPKVPVLALTPRRQEGAARPQRLGASRAYGQLKTKEGRKSERNVGAKTHSGVWKGVSFWEAEEHLQYPSLS